HADGLRKLLWAKCNLLNFAFRHGNIPRLGPKNVYYFGVQVVKMIFIRGIFRHSSIAKLLKSLSIESSNSIRFASLNLRSTVSALRRGVASARYVSSRLPSSVRLASTRSMSALASASFALSTLGGRPRLRLPDTTARKRC